MRKTSPVANVTVRADECAAGSVVEHSAPGVSTLVGYVVHLAGVVAVQPMTAGERHGLDARARFLHPSTQVRVIEPQRDWGVLGGGTFDPLRSN